MKRYRFLVTGHVQGVGFRYHVQHEANRRHLSGIVQNLPDRSVRVEVQGNLDEILDLKRYIEEDLPFATVRDVQLAEIEPLAGEAGFKIVH